MATRIDLVREFYTAAGFDPTSELSFSLIREEAAEVREALEHLLKEIADLQYVIAGAVGAGHLTDETSAELYEVMDPLVPLLSRIPEHISDEAFLRVHESNMSKLVDGKPVRDPETGKVLKGPNYQPPYLSDLI